MFPQHPSVQGASSSISQTQTPLHLALAFVLIKTFPLTPTRQPSVTYSSTFIAAALALVSREVFELCDSPASFDGLKTEVDRLVEPEVEAIRRLNDKVRSRGQAVGPEREAAEDAGSWLEAFKSSFLRVPDGCSFLDVLEKEIRERVNEDDEEDVMEIPQPIERRSPLGLFLRRLLLTLRRLSFSETSNLAAQVGTWCGAMSSGSRVYVSQSRRAAMEDTLETRLKAMEQINSATASGDHAAALASLRRFYDYRFPSATRGRHQHALLNIASYHYSTEGLGLAKKAIDEAIRVARAEGDKSCLKLCMSLSARIQAKLDDNYDGPSDRTIAETRLIADARLPPASGPTDELWNLKTGLQKGEPTHVALRRIQLAQGRFVSTRLRDDNLLSGWASEHTFDEGAWHASQAGLWAMMGSNALAELHEDLALEVEGTNVDARFTVLLNRAERYANSGDYDQALGILLDFDSLEGMSMIAYRQWSTRVREILRYKAELNGDYEAIDILNILAPSRQSPAVSKSIQSSAQNLVRDSLRKAGKMKELKTPIHIVLPQVLAAMHLSHDLGLWPLYRLSIVTFGEVMLEMEEQGMARKAIEEVEKIWPELSGSGDEETTARAALVLGKAMVAIYLEEDRPELLEHASQHLRRALKSAERVSARRLVEGATTLLRLIAEIQGCKVEEFSSQMEHVGMADTVRKVLEIVKLTNVRVCENWT